MPAATESEHMFERYLGEQNLRWSRLPGSTRKQPDYAVEHRGLTCLFEVKEFNEPAIEPSGGYTPSPPIQKKIRRVREKFREYQDRPCALVLWNSKTIFRSTQPEVVLSAAFGKYVVTEPQHADDLRADPRTYQFRGSAALTPNANTTMSAIVILAPYQLDQVWLEGWRRLSEKKRRGESIQPTDQFDLVQQAADDFVGPRYSYQGTVRVVVLENPYARVPFPPDLFMGPFDQRWHLESGRFRLCFMGSELTRLKQSGVPFIYL